MNLAIKYLEQLKSKERTERKSIYIWSVISCFFLGVIIYAVLKKGIWYYALIYLPLLMLHIQHFREYQKLRKLIKDLKQEIK